MWSPEVGEMAAIKQIPTNLKGRDRTVFVRGAEAAKETIATLFPPDEPEEA